MRILFLTIISFLLLVSKAQSQVMPEKLGLVVSTKKAMQGYNQMHGPYLADKDYFMNRIGGRISFGLNCRLSFSTGLYIDNHKINLASRNKKGLYTLRGNNLGLEIPGPRDQRNFLASHKMINATIPLNLMIRTYISRSCVTYVRLSYNHSINFYESEEYIGENYESNIMSITTQSGFDKQKYGLKYFGSDMEFAFGNFWNLDKLNAQFCIEPNITLLSSRTENLVIGDPNLVLYDKHTNAFTAIGIEVMLYKNLN